MTPLGLKRLLSHDRRDFRSPALTFFHIHPIKHSSVSRLICILLAVADYLRSTKISVVGH